MQRLTLLRSMRPRTDAVPHLVLRAFSSAASASPATSPPSPPTSYSSSTDPPLPPPTRLGVIGGGQMGTGIAYVSSVVAHLPVTIVDSNPSQLQRSRAFITSLLDKDEKKGRLNAQQKADALQRFSFTPHIQQVHPLPLHRFPHPSLHLPPPPPPSSTSRLPPDPTVCVRRCVCAVGG